MIRTVPLRRTTRLKSSGRLRPRRKTRKGRIPESVLDALWRQRILERDTNCRFAAVYDSCAGHLEAAHIYSRVYRQVRWALENGLALCTKHHFFAHRNPVLAGRIYERLLGGKALDSLWIRVQAKGKVDRVAVRAYLRSPALLAGGEER